MWFKGPEFLRQQNPITPTKPKQEVKATVLFVQPSRFFFLTSARHATEAITSGSMWETRREQTKMEKNLPNNIKATNELEKQMQLESWPQGMISIQKSKNQYKTKIRSLAPFFDTDEGLIKGGGRLQLSNLTFGRKHPTLIPDTELGDALIGFLHSSLTKHQGRKISSAAIREQGYYPVGGRKRIDRIISACTSCRTLRAS